jgi:hypothetical protein
MRKVLFLGMLIMACIRANAATYYTVADGSWTGAAVWSLTQGGAAIMWSSITLATNDVLEITNDLTITGGTITIAPNITINLKSTSADNASLSFNSGGKLVLSNSASTIVLGNTSGSSANDPTINDLGPGGGSSSLIDIGSNTVWNSSSPDPVTGTGTITTSSSPNDPLPIELLFFNCKKEGSSVKLNWSTASELNFDYFSVERSSNGKDFSELAQISGHGTTKVKQNYSFEDSRPLIGKNYYRLKSEDFDGYTEYFNTVVLDFLGEKQFDVSPNPSNGQGVSVILNFSAEPESTVTVFDNLGITMGVFKVSEERFISFQNTLKSGIYYAKFSAPGLSKVARFVVKE